MSVFLDEDMIGRDAALIGFPHIVVCMGFVAVTANELYGVHMTTPAHSMATFGGFWTWAQAKGLAAAAITDIYGSFDRKARYGASTDTAGWNAWTQEMTAFANHLVWHGPAHGFDTKIISPTRGTYVEYHLNLGGTHPCRILYKRDEKTTQQARVNIGTGGDVVCWSVGSSRLRPIWTTSTGVDINVTRSNKGQLHELDYALRMRTILV
jgi:hypothetical protein